MKKLKWLAVTIMMMTLISIAPIQSEASVNFTDVKQSDEFYKELNYIANLGIVQGHTQNGKQYYKPANNISRFQAAKMLVVATGNENHDVGNIVLKGTTTDEEYNYISKAVSLGYFKTNADSSIKPHELINRSELGYAVSIAFGLGEQISFLKPLMFTDVARSDSNAQNINALYYAGVSKGSNGAFGPNQLLTRSQFALFVARAMDKQFSLPVGNVSHSIIAKGKSKVNSLNVRTSPSATAGKIVGQLKQGEEFSVLKDHGDWIEIQYWNRPAFISKSKEYVDFLDSDSKPVGVPTHFAKINVKDTTLNVRTLPSVNGDVIGTLKNGEIVEVHGEKNGWSLITINGIPGYVNSSYTVKVDKPGDNDNSANGKLLGKVTVNSLNVRSGAGTNFPVTTTLKRGQKVEVTALNGFWATIVVNGKTGYVSKSFLKLLNQSSARLKDRIIVIDAGHGGSDPGASGNGIIEKNLTLDVSKRVEAKLKNAGAKVLMTRTGDTFPSLKSRTDYAKKHNAEIFVSIHGNSFTSPTANGIEVFYSSSNPNGDESRFLAQHIQRNLVNMTKLTNRGVKNNNFYVLGNNQVASVLVELGFMTNKADADKLKKNPDLFAEAIYQGIVQYYSAD